MDIKKEIRQNVIAGKGPQVRALVASALDQGAPPQEILNDALIDAMSEVGRRFECGEFFIPEMLIAARAMKEGLALLKPKLVNTGAKPIGRVVIGTVKGDLHDIGKNLVAIMLEGAGFEVIDLGIDVSPERFADAARENSANIVAMSALLSTTMLAMKTTIEALKAAGVRNGVNVMVGGAPVTQEYADVIGADLFAPDAASAAARARSLMTRLGPAK